MKKTQSHELLKQMNEVSQSINTEIKEILSKFHLNHTEFRLIHTLTQSNETSITELISSVQLANSTGTYTVDRMLKKGLIERKRTSGDRRYYAISLTEKGRNVYNKVKPDYEQYVERVFELLNEDEKATLSVLLDKMQSEKNQ